MSRACSQGWIRAYTDFTKGQQSPTIFHTWTAIATVAAALRRRVWIDRGGFYQLYPNLYTILVSSSGVGNKSTALKQTFESEALLEKAVPDISIMRGKLTINYLVEWMAQLTAKNPGGSAEVIIFCSEFKVFSRGIFESSMIEDLTDLYDNPKIWEYRTKTGGVYTIKRPCVNIAGASTPEWLTTGSAADFIGGGFSSRMIPVALVKNDKIISWPEREAVDKALEDPLVQDLASIAQLSGQFFVTKEAKKYFDDWYKIRDQYEKPDQRMKGYYSKKHDMVLKLSMALSASLSDDMVITEDHISAAMTLLIKVEQSMDFAYQGVAWGEEAKFQDKVLAKIRENGTISHAKLLNTFRYCMTGKQLATIVNTLVQGQVIEWTTQPTGGRPGATYTYKGDKDVT